VSGTTSVEELKSRKILQLRRPAQDETLIHIVRNVLTNHKGLAHVRADQ
jgi:hypothetical protein